LLDGKCVFCDFFGHRFFLSDKFQIEKDGLEASEMCSSQTEMPLMTTRAGTRLPLMLRHTAQPIQLSGVGA
jgi:hypothetical protein